MGDDAKVGYVSPADRLREDWSKDMPAQHKPSQVPAMPSECQMDVGAGMHARPASARLVPDPAEVAIAGRSMFARPSGGRR